MTDSAKRLRRAAEYLGRHQTRRVVAAAAAKGFGLALLLLGALVLFDRFAPGAEAVRSAALLPLWIRALGFLAAVVLPVVFVGRALVRRMPALRSLEESARTTEVQASTLREKLVPALQVLRTRDDASTSYSSDLVDAFVDQATDAVESVDVGKLPYNVDFSRALRWAGAGAAAIIALTVALGPSETGRGLFRVATAVAHLGPTPQPQIAVEPGDVSIPRGEDVHLMARVEHARFTHEGAQAVLEWRLGDQDSWRPVPLQGADVSGHDAEGDPVPAARFEHDFVEVRESFRYRFLHSDAVSDEFEVTAVPRPSLTIESVRYRYPAYTNLPDREVKDGSGDLAAVRGTVAEIRVRSTNEPSSGSIEFGTGETAGMIRDGKRHLLASVAIDEDGSYRLLVEDILGLTNPNPLEYRVRALTDEAPFVRLLEPGEDRDFDESMTVGLRFSAVDDYGLGPIRLVWEVSRREGESRERVVWTPEGTRTEAGARFEWNLEGLDLLPGDEVTYHLEVSDTNAIDGPRTARTRTYILRFPTLGEMFARIDDREAASIDDLADIIDEAKKVEEKVQEISREMLKQGDSSWENQKEMERALEQQQTLAAELQKTREEIEANLQDLRESEFATLEAMQKMEQIRKLMDEVANTEMKETLEKLRRAMEEANPRRQQDELGEFQESQDELLAQLERIMENLKQFRLEEKLRAAVREMEELAARQERVNDELAHLDREPTDDGTDRDDTNDSEGENSEGEDTEGENSEGEDTEGEDSDGESSEGEDTEGESSDGESSENQDASESDGAESESESESGDASASEEEKQAQMEQLAREEEALAEEARRMEELLKELAEMTEELRDAQDAQGMRELSEQMDSNNTPQTMDDMAGEMQSGGQQEAQEKGEKALTELREMLTALGAQQKGMAMKMIQISQAAINRAVRDLLSLSGDEEALALSLNTIPRNSSSATRSFADEQYLLIQGAERVETMLREVAKDTPLMDSQVGRSLDAGLESMRDAAFGLENGAVHVARDDGEKAVDELNAVVIQLLKTIQSMSSCPSGMPMSGLMQQLQELSGDQQKLNDALKKLMEEGGSSMDHRLQAQMQKLGQEQARIQQQLQQLLDEMGSGQGMLGRLDDVSKKLEEVADKLGRGKLDEEMLQEQDWALTRLLDSQRSMRERDLGRERRSETAEELAELLPPSTLPEGLEELDRDLREDLLKALERRYPPKYEDLIRRYFRSLSDEVAPPDLP